MESNPRPVITNKLDELFQKRLSEASDIVLQDNEARCKYYCSTLSNLYTYTCTGNGSYTLLVAASPSLC